jgi:hypothetical protein
LPALADLNYLKHKIIDVFYYKVCFGLPIYLKLMEALSNIPAQLVINRIAPLVAEYVI